MAKGTIKNSTRVNSRRPAITPEARENQCIALAMNLAEKQLEEGTASSQVITHFLKLGSSKAELEKEKIHRENILLEARAASIESAMQSDELYRNAIKAFKTYSGHMNEVVDDDY